MPGRLAQSERTNQLVTKLQRGDRARPLSAEKLRSTKESQRRLDDFQAAHSALEHAKHASGEDLLKAGFQQASVLSNGVQAAAGLDRRGLSEVVFEYQGANGAPVREAGLLGSVYQNHITLLQGPDLRPREFVNTFAKSEAAVPFKALFVRDAGLEQVNAGDARRLIAGAAPSVVWFHYPVPDSGEARFIFGKVTPGLEAYTVTTPDGREFKFHPDFLDELAKSAAFKASPLRGELPRGVSVSSGPPPGEVIGRKTEKSTPYTAAPTPRQEQAHQRITHALYNGEIELVADLHLGTVWKVKVKNVDPVTGELVASDAVMKVRVPGDKRAWNAPDESSGFGCTPLEYVGYFFNRLLTMDVVAPVAYRRGLNLRLPDGHLVTEAALSHYVPNLKTQLLDLAISSDATVLANVLEDPDLNQFNYGSGEHWVDGKVHDVRLDFAAAGSKMHGHQGTSKPVTTIRRPVYEALRILTVKDLQPLIDADFISAGKAKKYIENGRAIVRHIDRLVDEAKQRGADVATVITPE